MNHKDHIINVLKEVRRGGANPGEDLRVYLERMADTVLSYIPEEKKAAPKKFLGKDGEV